MTPRDYYAKTSSTSPYKSLDYPPDNNFENFCDNWESFQDNLIFFLGAGASVGAKNVSGEWLPAAQDLRNQLWKNYVCNKDERDTFDFSKLGLVTLDHTAALAEAKFDRPSLMKFIAQKFNVTKPLWQHAALPFLNPRALFTTNYDQLIELGWNVSHSSHKQKPLIQAFQALKPNSHYNHTPLYKPHGTIEYLNNPIGNGGLVISQFDYFEILNARREMIEQFMFDFNEKCVVFIGYSFQDMDIASYLYSIRKRHEGRAWYVVFPRNDYVVRHMYQTKYELRQINRTFFDFLKDLDDRFNIIPEKWKFENVDQLIHDGLIQGE